LPDPMNAAEHDDSRLHQEIIRQLSHVQGQLFQVAERLTRIEANSVHLDVERLRVALDKERERVDALMRDKDRRDGALGAAAWLHRSAPWAAFIAAGAAVLAWLRGN